MAWLVPYVINGAAHSAALFRRQAQRPASANSGVAEPTDLAVVKLPSAGPGFRIMPGSLSVKSRFPGRSRESYGVENGDSAVDVTGVVGTGSSARRDAVVVEVLDPNYSSVTHAEAELENYTRVSVVQNVPASAKDIRGIPGFTNRTAYVLAFINWPKEQTAIQSSYIQDARNLANPLRETELLEYSLTAAQGDTPVPTGTAYPAGGTWPASVETAWARVEVPETATHVRIKMNWNGVFVPVGEANGLGWVQMGMTVDPDSKVTQGVAWANVGSASYRTTFRATGTLSIPASMRGKEVNFYPRACWNYRANVAATPRLTATSSIDMDLEFFQRPI